MGIKDSVPNHNYQGGSGGGYTHERPKCTTCGKQHLDKCIVGKDGYFGCGNRGRKMRDYPILKAKGKETNKAPQEGPDSNTQMKNHFYMLQANK